MKELSLVIFSSQPLWINIELVVTLRFFGRSSVKRVMTMDVVHSCMNVAILVVFVVYIYIFFTNNGEVVICFCVCAMDKGLRVSINAWCRSRIASTLARPRIQSPPQCVPSWAQRARAPVGTAVGAAAAVGCFGASRRRCPSSDSWTGTWSPWKWKL